ncbi:unnamed protein product [Lasius platythorax]|uniref:Uncharacterized protein n=1 Tax=Lasius platythorax TaxID=488582 RepID=A0AAV2NY49_9HYME
MLHAYADLRKLQLTCISGTETCARSLDPAGDFLVVDSSPAMAGIVTCDSCFDASFRAPFSMIRVQDDPRRAVLPLDE